MPQSDFFSVATTQKGPSSGTVNFVAMDIIHDSFGLQHVPYEHYPLEKVLGTDLCSAA